ncbi:MAG: hybrid sensor histidine kinase/response regulator [Planctomycetes bacterium]|nr:hybrid sensor histidine kinase/response regulator [Planctomycetota bacterium]
MSDVTESAGLEATPASICKDENAEWASTRKSSTNHPTTKAPDVWQQLAKSSKVMIVDDELDVVLRVQKHLSDVGYERFVTTTQASKAIDLACREQPDVILLDIVMPEIDGLKILRALRRKQSLSMTPVLILTSASDARAKKIALHLGASEFLRKPVDPSELVLRVRNLLIVKAHYDQLRDYAVGLETEVARKDQQLIASRDEGVQRYMAGKAEIANEVLHNMGNALNSVNTSITVAQNILNDSRLSSLGKAAHLLCSNLQDPVNFFTRDERGKVLPEYLTELSSVLSDERRAVLDEIGTLERHVNHIRAIVNTQLRYVGVAGLLEPVCLSELLDDGLELVSFSLEDPRTEVVRDYAELPKLMLDKQKLLQVFVNLIKNAVHSLREADKSGSRLVLRTRQLKDDRISIEIADNGVGIDRNHLLKIFSHGFTTKPNGHGFGLHSCANLIAELGGSIRATSDGHGTGATFTVELPSCVAPEMQ